MASPGNAPGFASDILPKFRPKDIACMNRKGVKLSDPVWMQNLAGDAKYADHANARLVFEHLQAGDMPPDGAWPADWLTSYQSWMNGGFQP
jgi:hypothetical protein